MKIVPVAFALALLASPVAAQSANQFDLDCKIDVNNFQADGTTFDQTRASSPVHFTIDLKAKKWCRTNECAATLAPIANVTKERVSFVDKPEDQRYFNRADRTFVMTFSVDGTVRGLTFGVCKLAPFTPLPK